jgi:hypothetical protein
MAMRFLPGAAMDGGSGVGGLEPTRSVPRGDGRGFFFFMAERVIVYEKRRNEKENSFRAAPFPVTIGRSHGKKPPGGVRLAVNLQENRQKVPVDPCFGKKTSKRTPFDGFFAGRPLIGFR